MSVVSFHNISVVIFPVYHLSLYYTIYHPYYHCLLHGFLSLSLSCSPLFSFSAQYHSSELSFLIALSALRFAMTFVYIVCFPLSPALFACRRKMTRLTLFAAVDSQHHVLLKLLLKQNSTRLHQSLLRSLSGLASSLYKCVQGHSRYLETGCPNRGFIDFCVSKVWYKIHTTNKIDPIPLQTLLF